ncbi:ankyrin [Lophium mytilinum]|uniref:Ankyrin n=1 Tax=Lophium mytilinum TaxID=390894 RepID=A0A6A6Q994_9PEZI|nr:ankyrin [Lophium mytilinum]
MVNQPMYSRQGWFSPSLHVAVQCGNIPAIEHLVNTGANIDEYDSNYFTPLESVLTGSFANGHAGYDKTNVYGAAVRLVQLGAATGIVLTWPLALLLNHISSSADLSELLLEQAPAAACRKTPLLLNRMTTVSYTHISRDSLLRIPKFVPDTETEEDFGGRSFLHSAICSTGYSKVPHDWISALQKLTPFPWHHDWPHFHKMAFLTSGFEFYRRGLPHSTFARIMNIQPERGVSPLCRASSRGILEIMENCLKMDAEIDFEGCSLGSALMIACACGRLDAVKLLVRRGAAISYVGKNGLNSAMIAARRSKRVIAWLLVGQFNEQRRLNDSGELASSSGVSREVRPRSGIGTAALRLVGRREMQPHESSLDYAVRLAAMKREMRGKVVPL